MTLEEYKKQIEQDILDYAEDCKGYCTSLEQFRDDCWTADSVTGNGSGSYTFNAAEAEENVKELLFSNELKEMFAEFGYNSIPLEKGPEYIDVSIRCFLLDECLANVEDEVKEILEI